MKFCPKCKTDKLPEEFHKNRNTKDGLTVYCKVCQKVLSAVFCYRTFSVEKKIKHAQRAKEWQKKNSGKVKIVNRRCRLKRKYGLTEATFDAMLTAQNNKCAICARMLSEVKQTDVDHCHSTGKVRGILCNLCNTALGKFQDSEEVLTSAIEYLRKNK